MDETPQNQTPPPFSNANPSAFTAAQIETAKSKKVATGVLGILLGALGIHKFVLGYQLAGIIMFGVTIVGSVITTCLCLPGSGALVMAIIGIVEGITYLSKSDEEFCRTYIVNRREWF